MRMRAEDVLTIRGGLVEFKPGNVVLSKMGRDKGGFFVVLRTEEDYVYMSNGTTRKVDNPKKKKMKHLRETAGNNDFVAKKLAAGEKVTNTELRRELEDYENL